MSASSTYRNRISELRKERDETQEDLAAALKVSRQTVISIEGGKYNPSLPLIHLIIAHFDRPFQEIFYVIHDTAASTNGQHA